MAYDVFISYSSHDRAWATKLEADLKSRGLTNIFFDQRRLTKGEKWEPQLLADLMSSRHFLVLWSEKARGSDWVSEELYRFKGSIDPKGDGQPLPGRLLWAINLEGQNATLSGYQGYLEAGIQDEYKKFLAAPSQTVTLSAASQQTWDVWMSEIAGAAQSNNPAIQVCVAVLALTTDVLKTSPPVRPDFDFVEDPDLDAFLRHLGAGQFAELGSRYGATPFDWKPTGAETVRSLLDDLLGDPKTGINLKLTSLKQPPVRWRHLDVVTAPVNTLMDVAKPLLAGPCLIIVDPVALFSYSIWQRYIKLAPCFTNPQAAIVFLAPCAPNPPLLYLRECLAIQGSPNLEWFHDPIPFNPKYASCGINVADKWDIRRLVLASLGRQPASQGPSGGENIIN